jgi:hypothetical protein
LQITDGKEHLDQIKQLMIEYTTRLDRDLSFQNIDTELTNIRHRKVNCSSHWTTRA